MSGPKHLWSGDWENESRQPAVTTLPVYDEEPAAQSSAPAAAARRSGFSRRQLVIALSAGLVAAIITVALALTLGGGSDKRTPRAKHTGAASPRSHTNPAQPQTSGGGGLAKPSQRCQQKPASCVASTATPVVKSGPRADWMGLQIVTSPSGIVVSTVKLGSAGDLAGFEPGDQIDRVDGHIVGTVSEIRTDTNSLHLGAPVTVDVMRGSVSLTLASRHMTQRPIIHP